MVSTPTVGTELWQVGAQHNPALWIVAKCARHLFPRAGFRLLHAEPDPVHYGIRFRRQQKGRLGSEVMPSRTHWRSL